MSRPRLEDLRLMRCHHRGCQNEATDRLINSRGHVCGVFCPRHANEHYAAEVEAWEKTRETTTTEAP